MVDVRKGMTYGFQRAALSLKEAAVREAAMKSEDPQEAIEHHESNLSMHCAPSINYILAYPIPRLRDLPNNSSLRHSISTLLLPSHKSEIVVNGYLLRASIVVDDGKLTVARVCEKGR